MGYQPQRSCGQLAPNTQDPSRVLGLPFALVVTGHGVDTDRTCVGVGLCWPVISYNLVIPSVDFLFTAEEERVTISEGLHRSLPSMITEGIIEQVAGSQAHMLEVTQLAKISTIRLKV